MVSFRWKYLFIWLPDILHSFYRHTFATLSFIAEIFLFLYVGMDALDIEKWKLASSRCVFVHDQFIKFLLIFSLSDGLVCIHWCSVLFIGGIHGQNKNKWSCSFIHSLLSAKGPHLLLSYVGNHEQVSLFRFGSNKRTSFAFCLPPGSSPRW